VAAEATRGRSDVGQADAAGCALKKAVRGAVRRKLVEEVRVWYGVSERRACGAFRYPRSTHRYRSVDFL